jgi:DNA-binding IclR family transcriptional regulator
MKRAALLIRFPPKFYPAFGRVPSVAAAALLESMIPFAVIRKPCRGRADNRRLSPPRLCAYKWRIRSKQNQRPAGRTMTRPHQPPIRPDQASPVHGTQSIHRSVQLLRAIASRGRDGARLVDLTHHTGLEQPTARRILKSLIAEGIVTQQTGSRRYLLGHLVFELGLAAAPQFNLQKLCEPAMARIADKTGDTVFLTVRSGWDSVCVDRREGAFPIRTLTLDIGTRRPLGVGAGGIALLMDLSDEDIDEIIAANTPRLRRFGSIDAEVLRAMVQRARRLGYAVNDRQVTPGAISVGLPLTNRVGPAVAAISIGAIASRMGSARQRELAAILQQEVKALELSLREATGV